jgi:hypothetical protein
VSRYYKIDINNGQYIVTNQRPDGTLDPGGLRVEFDINAAPYATPTGQSTVIIWGVPLHAGGGFPGISQPSNLNLKPVSVSGGMQKGLPLASADANQNGILIVGQILQAFGNWIDVAQNIGLVITGAGEATQSDPANIVVNWKKGTKLADALTQTLTTAYPGMKSNVHIDDRLVLTADETHTSDTIQQLAMYVKDVSMDILPNPYAGVDLWVGNNVINVFDGSTETTPKTINFVDQIGQPTWLEAFKISFSTVMRADIQIGDFVKLNEINNLQSISSPQSQSISRNKNAFTGVWIITAVRHVGDSRAPAGNAWISVFEATSRQDPEFDASPDDTQA